MKPNLISNGEVLAGKYLSHSGYQFGDGTYQETAMGLLTRWTPNFSATGLTFTGSGETHPCYNSYYVKHLQMVNFQISVNLSTITNFGTGQFKVELPFTPFETFANHFNGWVWVNPSLPADDLNGHIIIQGDHLLGEKTLDLHWHKATTSSPKPVIESIFSQGTPVTLTTSSIIQIGGTYISI
jgi:hypothetical protein